MHVTSNRKKVLTTGGWLCSALMSCRYLLMFLDGSISSCSSLNNLWYFPGNLSQLSRNLDTATLPSPLIMANIELKFLHSLHCPAKQCSVLFRGFHILWILLTSYFDELLDNLHPSHWIGFTAHLGDHPEHLLVHQRGELVQHWRSVLGFELE